MLHRRELYSSQKRGPKVGKTKRGKGTKWIVLVDGAGTPLGAYLDAASPAEVTLLKHTLAHLQVRGRPQRLIADRRYDSNAAWRYLKRRRIQPIIPARCNNRTATDQDGRCLRRYRRRWIVERTIGWLGTFRRLTVRYDRLITAYGGFFHLACALLVLRKVLKPHSHAPAPASGYPSPWRIPPVAALPGGRLVIDIFPEECAISFFHTNWDTT